MNDRSGPDPLALDFWHEVARQANLSSSFEEGAQHLRDTVVELHRGSSALRLLFDRGTVSVEPVERAAALQLSGQDWYPLLEGRMHYSQAVNPHFGCIDVKGDALVAGWTLPSLSELFRVASQVWAAHLRSAGESRP